MSGARSESHLPSAPWSQIAALRESGVQRVRLVPQAGRDRPICGPIQLSEISRVPFEVLPIQLEAPAPKRWKRRSYDLHRRGRLRVPLGATLPHPERPTFAEEPADSLRWSAIVQNLVAAFVVLDGVARPAPRELAKAGTARGRREGLVWSRRAVYSGFSPSTLHKERSAKRVTIRPETGESGRLDQSATSADGVSAWRALPCWRRL